MLRAAPALDGPVWLGDVSRAVMPERSNSELAFDIPELLESTYGVYVELGDRVPTESELREILAAWIERRCSEPMRGTLLKYAETSLLTLRVGERDMLPEPSLEALEAFGLRDEEARRFEAATHLVHVHAVFQLVAPVLSLWGSLAAARAIAEALAGVVLDPQMPRLLPIASTSEPPSADGVVHVARYILVPMSVGADGHVWMTTYGMPRFGLPNVELRQVPPGLHERLVGIVNGVAQHFLGRALEAAAAAAHGLSRLLVPDEIELSTNDVALAFGAAPEPEAKSARIRLSWDPQAPKDVEPFVTLMPPRDFAGEHGEWLYALLAELYGKQETMRFAKRGSEAMRQAHRRAVDELPAVKKRFLRGLEPGETLYVKHGFPVADGELEFMWLSVTTWDATTIAGALANDSHHLAELRAGRSVNVEEAAVFDWMISGPEGGYEGGYTISAMERAE